MSYPEIGNVRVTSDLVADAAGDRTAIQLPTSSIINNFDNNSSNPFAGRYYITDFAHPSDFPTSTALDAASTMGLGATAIGELSFFTTTDNQAAEARFMTPIVVSGGTKWAFGVRIKCSQIANTEAGWFIGLMKPGALAGDEITDAAVIKDEAAIGFQNKEGDGDIVDFVYNEASQTQNEHDDDYVTLVADTYITLEMYFNGTTIQQYLNGVATGTAISATDIAAADFPTAEVLQPTFAQKSASGAADVTTTLDWMYVMQSAR